MPPRKKKKSAPKKKSVQRSNPHLPGTLMIAFGLIGLGVNYDLLAGLDWLKAYPLLAVLFGIVAIAEVLISRR